LLENLSNRPANRGGQQFGDRRIKQLQALAWFLTDRALRGLDFSMTLYKQEAVQYISYAEIDAESSKDEAAEKPAKVQIRAMGKVGGIGLPILRFDYQ